MAPTLFERAIVMDLWTAEDFTLTAAELECRKRGRMTRWLVVVEDDIEPRIEGPFKSDRTRITAAREHRRNDPDKRDGIFGLDISSSGSPEIHHFASCEVSPETDAI